MRRQDLEHIIRAAANIADDDTLIIIGSQAILGQYPSAPADLTVSMEADIYPKHHPERADLIDGSIGEGSPFHETFSYYAQGVGETTATLPEGWLERTIKIQNDNTRQAIGLCLEVHDLVLSKYAAGRDKDKRFIRAAIKAGYVEKTTLNTRLQTMPIPQAQQNLIAQAISRDFDAGPGK